MFMEVCVLQHSLLIVGKYFLCLYPCYMYDAFHRLLFVHPNNTANYGVSRSVIFCILFLLSLSDAYALSIYKTLHCIRCTDLKQCFFFF